MKKFDRSRSNKRGAALILEIIIYLVIVALIAVAVTSGVRAVRDLVFTAHAKADVQNVQQWAEGKYSQDNKYPVYPANFELEEHEVRLTTANGVTNIAKINVVNGANSGYCIVVGSATMSEPGKKWFWLSSANPSKIMQQGTATNVPAGSYSVPDSGIPGLTCP